MMCYRNKVIAKAISMSIGASLLGVGTAFAQMASLPSGDFGRIRIARNVQFWSDETYALINRILDSQRLMISPPNGTGNELLLTVVPQARTVDFAVNGRPIEELNRLGLSLFNRVNCTSCSSCESRPGVRAGSFTFRENYTFRFIQTIPPAQPEEVAYEVRYPLEGGKVFAHRRGADKDKDNIVLDLDSLNLTEPPKVSADQIDNRNLNGLGIPACIPEDRTPSPDGYGRNRRDDRMVLGRNPSPLPSLPSGVSMNLVPAPAGISPSNTRNNNYQPNGGRAAQ